MKSLLCIIVVFLILALRGIYLIPLLLLIKIDVFLDKIGVATARYGLKIMHKEKNDQMDN